MIGALALALAAASPAVDREAALRQAMECHAYSELALSLNGNDPRLLAAHIKLQNYWTKRRNDLGKEMRLTPEVVRIRELVIPIKAERYRDVMSGCIKAAPKKVFR